MEEFLGLILLVLIGVGIDGGNTKDWESNAKNIQLIKQSGKVKALDEEIHSKLSLNGSAAKHRRRFSCHVCLFDPFRTAGYRPGCGVRRSRRHCPHPLGDPRRSQPT